MHAFPIFVIKKKHMVNTKILSTVFLPPLFPPFPSLQFLAAKLPNLLSEIPPHYLYKKTVIYHSITQFPSSIKYTRIL